MINNVDKDGGGRNSPPVSLWRTTRISRPYGIAGLFLFFAVILLICYSNTFHSPWHLDDQPNILANPRIQISSLTLDQIWQSMTAKPGSGSIYRPVACLTLALNWFFGQDNVFGYHVVNFLIHLATTWSLFLAIGALLRTPRLREAYTDFQRLRIAVLATLLWALNPVQTQAVTYIVQRMASLAAMFAVLAVYFYLKARIEQDSKKGAVFIFASFIAYLLGLFSKENVVLLPLSVPVLEMLFVQTNRNNQSFIKFLAGAGIAGGLSFAAILLLRPDILEFTIHIYDERPFTLVERVLSEQRILLFYLSLLFFPVPGRLSIEHDIVLSTSLFSPWTTALAIATNALLILAAIRIGRKQPLIALAILFFYLNHIVESTFLPLELIFEHRNYLPSIFLFLPLAQGISFLFDRIRRHRWMLAVGILLVVVLIGLEGLATYTRNHVWQSEQSLWLDAHAKAPGSARPMSRLAVLLAWGENPTPAKYRKALELNQRALSARMNRKEEGDLLGNMASIHDKLGQSDQAVLYYEKALQVSPKHAANRYNFAKMLVTRGHFEKAREELEVLLEQGWEHADYYHLMGFADLWLGEPARALPLLNKALEKAPGRPDILLSTGNCLSSLGQYQKAKRYLGQAEINGGKSLIVFLNQIQNALAAGDKDGARKRLGETRALFSLDQIGRVLEFSEITYRIVPLDYQRLNAFITSETEQPQSSDNNGPS